MDRRITLIILLLLLVFGMVTVLLMVEPVEAFNPFKWQLCNSANATQGDCDDYWESFKEVMGISDKVNTTGINETFIDGKLTPFYNKTEIDLKISQLNNSIISINESVDLENSTFIEESFFNDWALNFRNNFSEVYAEKDLVEGLENRILGDGDGVSDNTILGIGAIAIVVIAGFVFMNKQQGKPQGQPQVKAGFKRIQSRTDMQETEEKNKEKELADLKHEKELAELKSEIANLNNKSEDKKK